MLLQSKNDELEVRDVRKVVPGFNLRVKEKMRNEPSKVVLR